MSVTYARTAASCPTPIGVTSPAFGQPSTPFSTTDRNPPPGTSLKFNQGMAALKLVMQCGGGGYAVVSGCDITVTSGLNVQMGVGILLLDSMIEVVASGSAGSAPFLQIDQPPAITLADNAVNFVYVSSTGTITSSTSTTFPVSTKLYRATVTTASGAVTNIDYSGVIFLRNGRLERTTADTGAPTDSLPSGLTVFTKTATDTFLWDGTAHRNISRTRTGSKLARTGSLLETCSRELVTGDSGALLASGTLYMIAVEVLEGCTVGHISFMSGTTAFNTPTHWWFALYDSSRALLGQTADQTTTAWAANTEKTLALGSSVNLQPGLYYVGILCTGTTPPSLLSASIDSHVAGLAPILCGSSDAGLTTTAPSTAAAITAAGKIPYGSLAA